MLELAIDLETFSSTDIKCGVHKYTEAPDFEIMLFGYSVDYGQRIVIDLCSGDKIPADIIDAIRNPNILKTAYNAAFEIACLSAYFGEDLEVEQWSCTQALAAQAGLPFGLGMVAKVLNTSAQKETIGRALIKYFCVPCKPSKSNGLRLRNMPEHDPAKWQMFIDYCAQDIATEQAIRISVLKWFKPLPFEEYLWFLDQKINTRGVMVDLQLVDNALRLNDIEIESIIKEVQESTGINNPNSDAQIKDYIFAETGVTVESFNKECMPDVYKQFKHCPNIIELLDARQKLSRTSIKKFVAMQNSAGRADRIRGLFQFCGANRTGRWAGRNVQLQNLKRNNLKDLDFARTLVRDGQMTTLQLTFGDVGEVLSNLIRSAFIPSPGFKLVVSDFSAIEARIIAWLAHETWRMDVFASHGKIYEASASMMFSIPLEDITKDLRQKGKVAELALGYQGALGALKRMGGEAMGLSDVEMTRIVTAWRKASPSIVRLWKNCEEAARGAITQGGVITVNKLCKFYMKAGNLHIQLPSGRVLVYQEAKFNGRSITYMGMDQIKKIWCKQDTYGGKIVENIVQAIARDVLANALMMVDRLNFDIVMHVHDEIVVEAIDIEAERTAKALTNILCQDIAWAKGLKLGAETFIAEYYTK